MFAITENRSKQWFSCVLVFLVCASGVDWALAQSVDQVDTTAQRATPPCSRAPIVADTQWDGHSVRSSRSVFSRSDTVSPNPQSATDPLDRSVIVEGGGDRITVLDGNTFEPVGRVRLRSPLTGNPQFSPDGRFVFLTTCDGWVSKVDMLSVKVASEVRVGLQTRNAAISGNGQYIAVANFHPRTLVILDSDLQLIKVLSATDKAGKRVSRVSSVHTAAARQSFVVALKDVEEIWEVSYNPTAPEIPLGVIHDFQYREGAFAPGFLNPNRTVLEQPLDEFTFSSSQDELIASSPDATRLHIINLDVRHRIAKWEPVGGFRLGCSYVWHQGADDLMAVPSKTGNTLLFIDTLSGKEFARLQLPGSVQLIRSHEGSRYLWAISSKNTTISDTLTVIDKTSLKAVSELVPLPDKWITHMGFSRDGKYLLASLAGSDGFVVVYNTLNMQEIKRIPIDEPNDIYNAQNSAKLIYGAHSIEP